MSDIILLSSILLMHIIEQT